MMSEKHMNGVKIQNSICKTIYDSLSLMGHGGTRKTAVVVLSTNRLHNFRFFESYGEIKVLISERELTKLKSVTSYAVLSIKFFDDNSGNTGKQLVSLLNLYNQEVVRDEEFEVFVFD